MGHIICIYSALSNLNNLFTYKCRNKTFNPSHSNKLYTLKLQRFITTWWLIYVATVWDFHQWIRLQVLDITIGKILLTAKDQLRFWCVCVRSICVLPLLPCLLRCDTGGRNKSSIPSFSFCCFSSSQTRLWQKCRSGKGFKVSQANMTWCHTVEKSLKEVKPTWVGAIQWKSSMS